MTKAELINDVVYEMAGYLTLEGIDRLKTVITFKLVNVNLTATETLPSTDVYDNEYIMKRYIIDLTATGRKQSTIKLYITIIKKFCTEPGLNYHSCTGQDVLFVSKRFGNSSTDVTIKYYICDDVELDRMQANLAA